MGLQSFGVSFDMGQPLAPLVQLLAVLPPESQQLLPPSYRKLMTVRAARAASALPRSSP